MSDLTTVELYKLEKYEIENNPHILARNGYLTIKIKDPGVETASLARFRPKPIQQRYFAFIDEIVANGDPVRLWVVKPRQVGLTTASETLMYARTSQRKGINSFIIANDSKGVDYIFTMAKIHQEFMEREFPHLAPKVKRTNKIELSFSDLHSTIFVDTARNASAGQKYTFQNVLLSEVALFENAEELFDGLMPAVPKHPGTMVIGECSAQGVGNFFHREVMRAYDKESTWKLFFPSWLEEPDYSKALNDDQLKFLEQTLTEEENKLIDVHNATPEQLWWRRFILIDEFRAKNISGDTYNLYLPDSTIQSAFDKFHQFYPSTVLEAFTASGRCRFEKSILQQWYYGCPRKRRDDEELELGKTYIQGYFQMDEKNKIVFIEQTDGPWTIFDLPKQGIDYCHGADVAEGIEIEEGSQKYDYSTQYFGRRDTGEQVAEYRAYIEPDLFAEQVFLGCAAYNHCTAGVEANKNGHTTINVLRDKFNYNNIYVREVIEPEKYNRRTKKLGWLTTEKTRKELINDLATFIRDQEGRFYSERLISECQSFIINPKGRPEAAQGTHDDLVFAAGIALQMDLRVPKTEAWKERKRLQISYRR
jgi:hypothetical protein